MLTLRPFKRGDIKWLISQFPDPYSLRMWSGNQFQFPLNKYQLKRHMKLTRAVYPRFEFFTALDKEKQPVGYGEISRISRDRSAFLSRILIQKNLRGRGLGSALVSRLIEIGFGQLGLHRLELNVFDFNRQAIHCYEKAGFIREGLLRDVCWTGKEFWSEYRMSILESEWRTTSMDLPDIH